MVVSGAANNWANDRPEDTLTSGHMSEFGAAEEGEGVEISSWAVEFME